MSYTPNPKLQAPNPKLYIVHDKPRGHVVMVIGPVDRNGDIFVGMQTWLADRLHHDLKSFEASSLTVRAWA